MTDNFDKMREYMIGLGFKEEYRTDCDVYFDVQLIRRGKDHPNLPSANYTFKTYYFDCISNFDKAKDEITKCCDMFGLRAYIAVNAKSKYEATLKTIAKYADNLSRGEARKPWRVFSSVCGGQTGKEKRWVVDCDDCGRIADYVSITKDFIKECDSAFENPIIMEIPTRSGYHIITHPFNLADFKRKFDDSVYNAPEIKKNHITLLYENIIKD